MMRIAHQILIYLSLSLALLAYAPTVSAQSALLFERAIVRIDSPALETKEDKGKPTHPTLEYDIEVRQEDALRLEYIHTLNTLTNETGVMILFETPALASLPAMKVYTPVDALFIADDGSILQIIPNIILGEITQDTSAKQPSKAFLFLKAGEAANRGIQPHDKVSGKMFTPALPIQE